MTVKILNKSRWKLITDNNWQCVKTRFLGLTNYSCMQSIAKDVILCKVAFTSALFLFFINHFTTKRYILLLTESIDVFKLTLFKQRMTLND